jgi:branched-chain amino acid transport system permease protein
VIVVYAMQHYLADFGTWYPILLGALAIATMLFAPKGIWDMSRSGTALCYFPCDECSRVK